MTKHKPSGPRGAGFQRFELVQPLLKAVQSAGYEEPRPIQAKAIPPALQGRDVLGLAQTGTGKTAAFVLPILSSLLRKRGKGRSDPRALILTPTRELASQIHEECERLGRYTEISSTVVFGGVPVARNERALKSRPDIVVACPGRLLDLMNRGHIRLDGVEVLVLDEADFMFDMGFLPDVRRILKALPARRQNLMFSATMPKEIRKLADKVLYEPTVVELAHSKPAETIDHALISLGEKQKVSALKRLLSDDSFRSAIVFLRTKRRAKKLALQLDKAGYDATALQGNMSQGQRERALLGFREGRFDVLVATDVAARGLDIAGVSHVINFDVPNTPDAYTHRIGRTGRSGLSGVAFTFATHDDSSALRAIEKRLGQPIPRRKTSDLDLREEPLREREPRSRAPRSEERPARRKKPKNAKNKGRGSRARERRARGPQAPGAPAPAAQRKLSAAHSPPSKPGPPRSSSVVFGKGAIDEPND